MTVAARELASDSRTVAFWTLVSRITGFGRVATLAAVLGPTFFGNLFQTSLMIPYVICELMAGSLITATLAPHLVRALDGEGRTAAQRLARGFAGTVLPLFAAVALLGMLVIPQLLSLLTLAVDEPAVRAKQQALGWALLMCLLPQIVLYGIAGIGIAVQHAHRRFAFATAAPVIENVGMIAVLALTAGLYGIGLDVDAVTMPQVLLLGLGSTFAVGLHAAAQWWGAFRLGIVLVPRPGWLDPEVRRIVRIAAMSSGSSGLNSIGLLALMVAAGQFPGGAVAFQIASNLFNLPIALCARPIAAAQLPLLSRCFARSALDEFQATYRYSLRLTLFIALPAALLFLGLPEVLASAVALGEMRSPGAIMLVAASISGLGPGIVTEAAFIVSTSAAYARHDAASPLHAMAIRLAIVLAGVALPPSVGHDELTLWHLGLAASLASATAAGYLHWRLRRALPPAAGSSGSWPAADLGIAAVAVAPAALIATWLPASQGGILTSLIEGALLVALAGGIYLTLQHLRGSPELHGLLGRARGRDPEGAESGTAT
ncbi:MAG TPA: lipid II flippase MurJ [Amaricoccus sp.]|uniref:murein biosynthesis integral membrane protein MurJ n=1 Tax=Amaricoccus sp. TaxID=1872485 RepID=UPI002C47E921|nr:lipid II flippase MurJ [Amaricoccus sp.]HMR31268.1 lipid II flippase MurJ [Geminicoccus sp.]HMU00264.1 lipid II flippase MurJ [Amaricoccus sp.]